MATKKTGFLIFLIALALGAISLSGMEYAFAQRPPVRKKKVKDPGQMAVITVDGAAIYEKANFDSPVLDYLERGKKVLISNRLYRGIGGLGAFYKIKVRKGVFGYVTDVDVQIDKSAKAQNDDDEDDELDDPTKIRADLEKASPNEGGDLGTSLYLTRFLGAGINQINYAETIAKKKQSSDTMLVAMKMSGPGKFLGGLPLDFEFAFTTSAPDFYSKSFSSSKGFLLMGHAMTIFPLAELKKSMFYYGCGLMAKYSKFDVVRRNNTNKSVVDAQDLVLGLGGHVGYAYALTPRLSLRVDAKYYLEKENYLGYGAALQMKY